MFSCNCWGRCSCCWEWCPSCGGTGRRRRHWPVVPYVAPPLPWWQQPTYVSNAADRAKNFLSGS